MAGRSLPASSRSHPLRLGAGEAPEGLKLLAEDEGAHDSVLMPRRHGPVGDVSDTEDFFDVAQQLQQAEVRERLKAFVESNRGFRSRRVGPGSGSGSSRGHRETVASLRHVASLSRRHVEATKFSSLSCVSEGSSEGIIPGSSHQLPDFQSAAARDFQSDVCSSGAPASGEDGISAVLEDSFDGDRLSVPPHHGQFASTDGVLSLPSDCFATKDELAAVLACLRRLERKVDWLMSQERKAKAFESAVVFRPVSLLEHFYDSFWIPAKSTLRRSVWPCRLFVPALDLVEAAARYIFN